MTNTIKRYDASYKKLFTHRELVISLLQGFVPKNIYENMDLSTLEVLPTEHITSHNHERRNDLLWKMKYDNNYCYLVIMLEFQSTEDWWMALRVTEYTTLLLQDIIKNRKLVKNDKLPLVFPFVLYNGDKRWDAPTNIDNLLPEHNINIDIYQPHQHYYLLDIKHSCNLSKAYKNNLSTSVFAFENAASLEEIIEILGNLVKILPDNDRLHIHEAFINLLATNIIEESDLGDQLISCKSIQEAYAMLIAEAPRWKVNLMNEGFLKGKEEGIAIGKEEGIAIGKAQGYSSGKGDGVSLGIKKVIIDILNAKFNQIPNDISTMINQVIDISSLENIAIQASKAQSLQEFIKHIG